MLIKYNQKDLEEFKQVITARLKIAKEQLDFYLKQIQDFAESPESQVKGFSEGGIGTVESERLHTMADRQKKLIQHLENALLRIKNKTYGICRVTGKLISKQRLLAVPHATLSIDAKQKR